MGLIDQVLKQVGRGFSSPDLFFFGVGGGDCPTTEMAFNDRRAFSPEWHSQSVTAEWQAEQAFFCHSLPLSERMRTIAIKCHSMPFLGIKYFKSRDPEGVLRLWEPPLSSLKLQV